MHQFQLNIVVAVISVFFSSVCWLVVLIIIAARIITKFSVFYIYKIPMFNFDSPKNVASHFCGAICFYHSHRVTDIFVENIHKRLARKQSW